MPKSRTNEELQTIAIPEEIPWGGQSNGLNERKRVPQVHWRILDERERRERNLRAHHIQLLNQTKTWEGFSAWLLHLREYLEEVSMSHMMQQWPEPLDWPKIAPDDLFRDMGPWPEQKYWADRRWVGQRFLQLQRWGHGKLSKEEIKLRWHEARGQLWLLVSQREGEELIDQILENKAYWLQQTQQAWDDLDAGEEWPTERNRGETVLLLDEVFWTETFPEMVYGRSYWCRARKERQSRYPGLVKSHRTAENAVQTAAEALREYQQDAWQASLKPRPPIGHAWSGIFPPGQADREGIEIEYAIAGLDVVLQEAKQKLSEAKKILESCVSAVTIPQKSPLGRREKSALNTAIMELDKKHPKGKFSDNQILQRIHTLLYVAGIWPKDEYQSLTAKFYQLRKQHSK